MFTTLFSLSLLLALVHSVLAQSGLTIDTPNFVQCQPTQITWNGSGNPPYDLLIVPAQDMCGDALEDLGNQTSTAMAWTVNLASGTKVVLSLEDAAGNEAWSGAITVGPSNDTSCLKNTSSATSTPATSASSPTSSAFSPAGAAGAGLVPTSGAPSMHPFSAATLMGSAVLVAFIL